MKLGAGELSELYLENGLTGGRLLCPQHLIPTPGQYLLAHDVASNAPYLLPFLVPVLFQVGFWLLRQSHRPGNQVYHFRYAAGSEMDFPYLKSARRVALAPLGETSARLKPLLVAALEQIASVVLVSDMDWPDLVPEVEIQPVSTLAEVAHWADYLAIDTPRDNLPVLGEIFGLGEQAKVDLEAQVLVFTPMPCGGMADCGVCSVTYRRGWKMVCKNGPVFELKELTKNRTRYRGEGLGQRLYP